MLKERYSNFKKRKILTLRISDYDIKIYNQTQFLDRILWDVIKREVLCIINFTQDLNLWAYKSSNIMIQITEIYIYPVHK